MEQKNEAQSGTRINIGSVSIVVIFAVLCLTVFSVLSLSTASTERRLAERSAAAVTAYYAADRVCAEKADAILEALKAGADADEIADRAAEFGVEAVSTGGGTAVLGFTQAIDDAQMLSVTLRLHGSEMEILCWNTVDTGTWTPADTLTVWDGN